MNLYGIQNIFARGRTQNTTMSKGNDTQSLLFTSCYFPLFILSFSFPFVDVHHHVDELQAEVGQLKRSKMKKQSYQNPIAVQSLKKR